MLAAALMLGASIPQNSQTGIGFFEDSVRIASANLALPNGTLDLRIAKARGDRGYNKARISVVSHGTPLLGAHIVGTASGGTDGVPFDYSEPFDYRWAASFDLGTKAMRCSKDHVYNSTKTTYDADCMLMCSYDTSCGYYTWFPKKKICELARSGCLLESDTTAEASYLNYGRNYLESTVVSLVPGSNHLSVMSAEGTPIQSFDVNMPEQGSGIRGLILSDPCFSGRWVDCKYGSWDALNRTVLLLNALAESGDIDFFAILGDNFYDQDGRLTSAVWRGLSPAFKSSFLVSTPGNHDIWVAGGPGPTADQYDQYGYGFMQWYAQDSLAAGASDGTQDGATVFNFSAAPAVPDPNKLNNAVDNFLLYHQIGNVGIIAYVGGGANITELTPGLQKACTFMGASASTIEQVLLLGHWNGPGAGCPAESATPNVRNLIASLPGCAGFGNALRFVDGHTHCNQKQGTEGFLIGGHGMSGCGQVGFMLVDTTAPVASAGAAAPPSSMRVSYFEERTASVDRFDEVLACIKQSGVSGCTRLAEAWL
jgi:hypothetical protein